MSQVRSLRGSLSSKTRETIFSTFGELNLPTINAKSSITEIADWKAKPSVASCYERLFNRMREDDLESPTVLTHIIQKVFLDRSFSNAEVAFVIAICTTMLNPKCDKIVLDKDTMIRKVKYYLVGLILLYLNKYHYIN